MSVRLHAGGPGRGRRAGVGPGTRRPPPPGPSSTPARPASRTPQAGAAHTRWCPGNFADTAAGEEERRKCAPSGRSGLAGPGALRGTKAAARTGGQRAEPASRSSPGDAGSALARATAPHAPRALAEPVARSMRAGAAAGEAPNVPGCFGELRSRGLFCRGVTRKAQRRCRRESNCIYREVAKFGGSPLSNSSPCAGEVLELTPWPGGERL